MVIWNDILYDEVGGCAELHFLLNVFSIYFRDHRNVTCTRIDCQHKGIGVLFGIGISYNRLSLHLIDIFALSYSDLSFIEDQFQLDHQYTKDSCVEDEGGKASAGVGNLALLPYAPESAFWEHADGCEEGRH